MGAPIKRPLLHLLIVNLLKRNISMDSAKILAGSFLVLFLIICSVSVRAEIYYVDENGNDNTGNGSTGNPFATLSHAATVVTTSGDIIHVNLGTIVESSTTHLAVGVSIEGEGSGSVIQSLVTADYGYTIELSSIVVNTNGKQHISGLRFDGNGETAWGAIYIQARGNVAIHDCTFENFRFTAVVFNGKTSDYDESEPTQWTYNNSFYNNTVTNCSAEQVGGWMSGSLHIGVLDGMDIYNNSFNETARGPGNCGYPIKYYNAGYNRNLKIHDNTIIKLPSSSNSNDWNFAIELWNYRGAVEIYNNHIEGSIDIDHVKKGIYEYGLKIHDNYFGYSSLPPSSGEGANLSAGLYIEYGCEDIYIYNNEFNNLEAAIRFSPRNEYVNGVHIYYNVINQIGNTNRDAGCNILNFAGDGYTIDNLLFDNNTIYAGSTGAQYGIYIRGEHAENFNNTTIQNNIIYGFESFPIEIDGNNKNSLSIENNIFYGNGTNEAHVTGSPSNYINQNNIIHDPELENPGINWMPKSTSVCRNNGKNVGLVSDFKGNQIIGLPDIGAFEYQNRSFPWLLLLL